MTISWFWSYHCQRLITQLLTDRMLFLTPNQQWQNTEGNAQATSVAVKIIAVVPNTWNTFSLGRKIYDCNQLYSLNTSFVNIFIFIWVKKEQQQKLQIKRIKQKPLFRRSTSAKPPCELPTKTRLTTNIEAMQHRRWHIKWAAAMVTGYCKMYQYIYVHNFVKCRLTLYFTIRVNVLCSTQQRKSHFRNAHPSQ